jgi:hypothetical protein
LRPNITTSKKEDSAYKFMLLFLPLLSHADLLYQKGIARKGSRWRWESAELFSEEMIDIAENIQAIQNWIESGIPPNRLTADTVLVEADDFEDDTGKDERSHAELFFTASGGIQPTADTTSIDRTFGTEYFSAPGFTQEPTEKHKMHGQEDPASSCDLKSEEPNRLFIKSTSQLNTLSILQFIKAWDQQDGTQDSIPVTENIRPSAEGFVEATGTWDNGNPSMHGVCTPI